MPDHYEPYEDDERSIAALLITASLAGGILALLRDTPGSIGGIPFGLLIRQRRTGPMFASRWWSNAWQAFEERLAVLLLSLARGARLRTLRGLPRRLSGGVSDRVAGRLILDYSAEVAAETMAATRSGIAAIAEDLSRFDVSRRRLEVLLAERLGPTEAQWSGPRGIGTWERRAIAEGKLSAEEIRRGVRRRWRAAVLARARALGSDTTVRTVSLQAVAVYQEAGLLVSSGNPLDERTGDLDRIQTIETRKRPTPAGSSWTPTAPYRGLMPYHARCRCFLEWHSARAL